MRSACVSRRHSARGMSGKGLVCSHQLRLPAQAVDVEEKWELDPVGRAGGDGVTTRKSEDEQSYSASAWELAPDAGSDVASLGIQRCIVRLP